MIVNSPLDVLIEDLQTIREDVRAVGAELLARWQTGIERRAFCLGAVNLAHYLALRQHDLRPLQLELMLYGVSSLGRVEARVLPNLDAVIAVLRAIRGDRHAPIQPRRGQFFRGNRLLRHNTDEVFGISQDGRDVRIMVTLPSHAATDPDFVADLVTRGMDVARINCAHDDADAWLAMIANVRAAGRHVRIHMDLAGPKVRTADLMMQDKHAFVGDTILLRRDPPVRADDHPIQMRCTLRQVIDQVRVGESVWIDDGKVGTIVEAVTPQGVLLRITHAQDNGVKLKPEKGLNFPDTDLRLDPLTDEDRQALDVITLHADMIGYSFVQDASDIANLQAELAARRPDWRRLAIIAKIETRRAIHNLPELIVAAASTQPFGVMIARGDLAVEVGFQRMAEIQEEILWLCEAAHIPVIWATQVLESFIKRGTPSRGEMTDAAMGARAECVMLNKGVHVGEAITLLDGLFGRMRGHQFKKTPRMRALSAWTDVLSPDA